jgi:hypothetical protein
MSDSGEHDTGDRHGSESTSVMDERRQESRGRAWIIAIAVVSLGMIACMCSFIFLIALMRT